jgi:drug/metabolite transporter (DMT)-like permease
LNGKTRKITKLQPLLIPLLAILISLVAISIVLLLMGKNPLTAFLSILQGSGWVPKPRYSSGAGQVSDFFYMIDALTPMIFAALAVCFGDFSRTGETTAESWLATLYLIVFGSVIAYSAYIILLRSQPTSKVSTHSFVNPIVAVLLGWAFAGESVTIYTAIASALIAVSVAGILKGS